MKELKGIISALLVSYAEDGSLDEAGTRAIIRHNIDKVGIDGLYVGGSTGENFMIPTEMKKRIFEIAKDEVNGAVPLVAQVGAINLHESIELAKFVKELGGYVALSAVTPFYYKFNFKEIKEYYNAIIAASGMDMIVYSIPFLTGVDLGLQQFAELYENPKIIGVKFTAADFYLLERLKMKFPNHKIYSGFDEMLLPAVIYGVDGAIGSTYNIDGKIANTIFTQAQAGNIPEALKAQHLLNNFISEVLANGLYQTLKECLSLAGVKAELKVRAPMAQLTPTQKEKAKEIFAIIKDHI